MTHDPRAIRILVEQVSANFLRSALAEQNELTELVRKALPPSLRPHCVHCVSRDGCVLIYCDGPEWTTQIRFSGPAVLTSLRDRYGGRFREVQARNLMPVDAISVKAQPGALSRSVGVSISSDMVRDCADNASGPLRESLLRLSLTLSRLRE